MYGIVVLLVALLICLKTFHANAKAWEGGAELYFDGIDDFVTVFPSFKLLSDWTIEAWVQPSSIRDRQCLMHLSTYSAVNLFALEANRDKWKIRYGEHHLLLNSSILHPSSQQREFGFTISQHHVAITHKMLPGSQAQLSFYLNGTRAMTALVPLPEIPDPAVAFVFGTCHEIAGSGILREHPFQGHVDELRHWTSVRSTSEVQSLMRLSGPSTRWPEKILLDDDHAKMRCQCGVGYTGTIVWDTKLVAHTGKCDIVACPGVSMPAPGPSCVCPRGYKGSYSWKSNSQQYSGRCGRVPCPRAPGIIEDSTGCSCRAGYIGTIIWDPSATMLDEMWKGSCRLANCPPNSLMSYNRTSCECNIDDGWMGTLNWNFDTQSYDNSCTKDGVTSTSSPTITVSTTRSKLGEYDSLNDTSSNTTNAGFQTTSPMPLMAPADGTDCHSCLAQFAAKGGCVATRMQLAPVHMEAYVPSGCELCIKSSSTWCTDYLAFPSAEHLLPCLPGTLWRPLSAGPGATAGACDPLSCPSGAQPVYEVSSQKKQLVMDKDGEIIVSPGQTLAQIVVDTLEAQYNFDSMTDLIVYDSAIDEGRKLLDKDEMGSSTSHDGMLGGGTSRESPRYERSVFGELEGGAQYFELRKQAKVSCPSVSCMEFDQLLTGAAGVNYNALLIRSVPKNQHKGVYLTLQGSDQPLEAMTITNKSTILVHTESLVAFDTFEIQPCRGRKQEAPSVSRCLSEKVRKVVFKVLENRPPLAGESHSIQLLGSQGYLQLQEPLRESATIEFWLKMTHMDDNQALFSMSNKAGKSMIHLGFFNGQFEFHSCSTQDAFDGVIPKTVFLPQLHTIETQHIAISWEYERTVRGRAVYRVSIYQNCKKLVNTFQVQDSCFRFGQDDESLELPMFGQRWEAGPTALIPSNFASAYFKDIRVWSRAVPQSEICNQITVRLTGNEQGLQGYFPVSNADAKAVQAGASILQNVAKRAGNVMSPPMDLKCSKLCGYCPDFSRSVGYAIRPSVFHLPAETLQLVTTAGRLDGYRTLPPLQLQLHMFDPDNYDPHTLEEKKLDDMFVQVVQGPNHACGALFKSDQRALVTKNENVTRWELPLYFKPLYQQNLDFDNATCTTEMAYIAIDTAGLAAPFSMKFGLVVKVPGPQILEVLAIEPGLSDNKVDIGDMVTIRFDRPTTRGNDYTKYLEVVRGSFGQAGISASWNDVGDVLLLEVLSRPESLNIIPGQTFFKFRSDLGKPIYTADVDSYPSVATSPVVKGNFNTSFCSSGMIFVKETSNCKACPNGTAYSEDGMHCVPCAPGTFSKYMSSPKCKECEKGTYLPAGSSDRSKCIQALPGRYVAVAGSPEDFACPKDTVAEHPGAEGCTPCPEGADCETPEHFRTRKVPRKSYFRMPDGSIEKCKVPGLCQQDNQCIPGHVGMMCYKCVEGQQTVRECEAHHTDCNSDSNNMVDVYFSRSFDKPRSMCAGCPASSVNEFLVFLVPAATCVSIWIWGALSYDAALYGHMHAVIFRVVLNYFTSISVLARLERWEYEPMLGTENSAAVEVALGTIFRFDGGFPAHLMELNCFFTQVSGLDHWQALKSQTMLWLMLPLLLPLGLLVASIVIFESYTYYIRLVLLIRQEIWSPTYLQDLESMHRQEFIKQSRFLFCFRKLATKCPIQDRLRIIFKDCVPLLFICHFVIYPTVVRHLLIMLTCEKFSEAETSDSMLVAVPDVQCFKGEHMTWASASVAGLFVWGLGIPLALYFFLKANRAKMNINVRIKALTGFVADGYESDFFYWESVVQLRRLALLFVAVLPGLDHNGELALYQLIAIGSIVLHLNAKPFDNRAGELLDKIELYGLLNFFLLVSAMQVIFLVDAQNSTGMLPAFVTGLLVFVASFFVNRNFLGHLWIFKAAGLCYFALVLIVYSLGDEGTLRQLAAFLFFMLAATLNLYYVLWVAFMALQQLRKSAADAFIQSRAPGSPTSSPSGSPSGSPSSSRSGRGAGAARGRGSVARGSTSMLDIALSESEQGSGGSWFTKLQAFLAKSESQSQGALIRFDSTANELVLGLHPEAYMKDAHLSAYARRTLARSGPFLTDQEREYISMALKDCFQHVIVSCASDKISCYLLEFLCRLAFTWKFRKQELKANLTEMMFDEDTFEQGMTAADFQAELMQVMNMSKRKFDELFKDFATVKEEINQQK